MKATVNGVVSRGVRACRIDERGHLIFTLTDGQHLDLGKVSGSEGGNGDMLSFIYDPDEGLRQVAFKDQLHTHRNKALLDSYTQSETALADAVNKKHEHENMSVLDQLTPEVWSNLQTKIMVNGMLKANGNGYVLKAEPGVDYQLPLLFDSAPTPISERPVTSGGLYDTMRSITALFRAADWVQSSEGAPFTQTVTGVDGATPDWNDKLLPPMTEHYAITETDEALRDALAAMCAAGYSVVVGDGSVSWSTAERPDADVPLYLFRQL